MTTKQMKARQAKGARYRIKLPSDTANLKIIREFVIGIAENMGFDEEDIYNIELAVDEACANIIKHAYKEDVNQDRIIDLAVKTKPDRIEIIIVDRGKGFNPQKIYQPKIKEHLRKMKRGGLGIYLMKKLMDQVQFRIRPGIRNEVKLIKYLKTRTTK